MKRRDFFRNGLFASLGASALGTGMAYGKNGFSTQRKAAKNIIFLVSDGMSTGTLNMADLLVRQKEGRGSHWIDLYRSNKGKRALMDTASANSFVTDSAAAGSSWGGGMRVNNGALNVGPNGEKPVPILQKFKSAGKSVGCVTSVQITHATPASFCVNEESRGSMEAIAETYLDLKFDVMMGGGDELFNKEKRKDKRDLYADFKKSGIQVAKSKDDLKSLTTDAPVLGVFSEGGLPYAVDRESDADLKKTVPSMYDMTKSAIDILKKNPKGFAMQIEGGKVDWAAHANDAPALLYDQVDFDLALGYVLDFAEKDGETLVIITTDHGNANPGLFSGNYEGKFSNLYTTTRSNEWLLNQLTGENTPSQVQDLFESYQGIKLKAEEAKSILKDYQNVNEEGLYDSGKIPNHLLASLQSSYTGIGWAGTSHSGDFVELAMYGPGSESLPPFIENYKLHGFMLEAAGVYGLALAY
ncbi:alkaline phosphatase [Pleomorphovibrio marinus]|uniref:alkaline phosphatase n=1 Tax=Pleomorphovibrio marinus TaxID=2164132 RepID=UPI000E0B0C11|nr:alkaline phosphatase [Pleomorphovibrio marinus]